MSAKKVEHFYKLGKADRTSTHVIDESLASYLQKIHLPFPSATA